MTSETRSQQKDCKRLKAEFTMLCSRLQNEIDDKNIVPIAARQALINVTVCYTQLVDTMHVLVERYQIYGEVDRIARKLAEEDKLEVEIDFVTQKVNDYIRHYKEPETVHSTAFQQETLNSSRNKQKEEDETIKKEQEKAEEKEEDAEMETFLNQAREKFHTLLKKRKGREMHRKTSSYVHDRTDHSRTPSPVPGLSQSATMTKGKHEPLFRPAKSSTPHHDDARSRGYQQSPYREPDRTPRADRFWDDPEMEEKLEREMRQAKIWEKPPEFLNPGRPPRHLPEDVQYPAVPAYDTTHMLARHKLDQFDGEKDNYSGWWAVFDRLVNKNPKLPVDIKYLMLRNSVTGVAAKAIKKLPQSELAYEVAITRLQRKFGGRRRDMTIRLNDLAKFKTVREGHAGDLERYAELLEGLVISFSEAGEEADMSGASLYHQVQQKLSESTLIRYNHWRKDKQLPPTVHSVRSFINAEAEDAMEASEMVRGMSSGSEKPVRETRERPVRNYLTHEGKSSDKNWKACPMCTQEHALWRCEDFKKLPNVARWNKAKEVRACFRCLSITHRAEKCQTNRVCNVNGCKKTHHWLLHEERNNPGKAGGTAAKDAASPPSADKNLSQSGVPRMSAPGSVASGPPMSHASTHVTLPSGKTAYIALRTVSVLVCANGMSLNINALLDDGSTRSYLNEDVATQLQLQGVPSCLMVNTLNAQQTRLDSSVVKFCIQSLDGKVDEMMSAHTTRQVTGKMVAVDWNSIKEQWPHLSSLPFPKTNKHPYVDLLLGLDMLPLHDCLDEVYGQAGEPVARETPLGWTCVGSPGGAYDDTMTQFNFCQYHELPSEAAIRQLWDMEETPDTPYVKPEDKDAMQKLQEHLTYVDGRFCMGLPWIAEKPERTNFEGAKSRMQQLRRKLLKDPEMGKQYTQVFRDYVDRGYIQEMELLPSNMNNCWFIPHFAVVKLERETTKYRVVFDGAARDGGRSLNDYLYTGPKLQQNLVYVLMRLRRFAVGIVCDISQMYQQILLHDDDQPYHSFVWQDLDEEVKIRIFRFLRVLFGARCSPCMAQLVAKTNAERHQEELPRAAETVLLSTYMDDSMDSVNDDNQAIQLYHDLKKLWAYAGMNARKWLTNSPEVLQQIPVEDRVASVDITSNELPQTKTLGVLWRAQDDVFSFRITPRDYDIQFTKRSYLSMMSTLFDPLGLVSPVVIQAKMLFQRIWTLGLGWDEALPDDVCEEARSWFHRLTKLEDVVVEHALQQQDADGEPELHIFTDASLDAYGAVVYCRTTYSNPPRVVVRLVLSRTRVTPLHSVSVPKLELMAAVTGVKAAEEVGRVLQLPMHSWKFWTDSLDVLYWIRGRSREFKPFVGNRIATIQTRSIPETWQHVGTKSNPADKLSRGVDADQLAADDLWWHGPAFLLEEPSTWPRHDLGSAATTKEKKTRFLTETYHVAEDPPSYKATPALTLQCTRLDPLRYSSLKVLQKRVAHVLRFGSNCQAPKERRTVGGLTTLEYDAALALLVKYAQYEGFSKDWKAICEGRNVDTGSALAAMQPWRDADGVVRSRSRLSEASCLPFDQKFPVLLPRRHRVTELIVSQQHEDAAHGGTNKVLYLLSERYWILAAREVIREVEHKCMRCRRRRARPEGQQMAPLPSVRVDPTYQAFEVCSVDFGGPFLTRQGRGRARAKRYLCLFACVQVRAVHLELAYGLDTSSFLNALGRMVARRGAPKVIISDNGTNFVSGNRELRELWDALDKDAVVERAAGQGIKWEFNPPAAPHFNGLHESLIKSAKNVIKEIANEAVLTDEELTTVFCQTEYLLNSRPLTYQSSHPQDLRPLTPNHFLLGIAGKNISPEQSDVGGRTLAGRWRALQKLNRCFWERWIREWVSSLSGRSKWRQQSRNVKIDDVVIMASPDSPRGQWPLGRITAVFPGPDGLVRAADVRIGDQTYRRPIVKLCVLDVDQPE